MSIPSNRPPPSSAKTIDLFVWGPLFKTDIPELDAQHQRLLNMVNQLNQMLIETEQWDPRPQEFFGVVDELRAYIQIHFGTEEGLMKAFSFDPAREQSHRQVHRSFVRQMERLTMEAHVNPTETIAHLLGFLSKWLINHIVGVDVPMAHGLKLMQAGESPKAALAAEKNAMRHTGKALLLAVDHLYDNLTLRAQDLLSVKTRLDEEVMRRKKTEVRLLQQNQVLITIIKSLPGIFYMIDSAGKFRRVNPLLSSVTGFSDAELEQMTVHDLFVAEDAPLVDQKLKEGFESGHTWVEARLRLKSGDAVPYHFTGARTELEGKDYLLGLGTDMTRHFELELELTRLSQTDALTGLFNLRHFLALSNKELSRAKRFDRLPSLLMFDVDYFKSVNDAYGHQRGDEVLKRIGEVCRRHLRAVDILGRIGGEEFAILMPETSTRSAWEAAERLRRSIAAEQIQMEGSPDNPLQVTISIGVAKVLVSDQQIDSALQRADRSMYHAKQGGRNRVSVSDG